MSSSEQSSSEQSSSEQSSSEQSSSEQSSSGRTSQKTNDKLVYMANQIGTFFRSQDPGTVSAKIAEHITKFWDPRMRKAILDHVDAGGGGLDPAARQAVELLRSPPTA